MAAPATHPGGGRAASGPRSWSRSLLVLNGAGGLAVLGSYAWGFLARPDAMSGLWGGVPAEARPLYTANMLLAATGYFFFTPYIVAHLAAAADEARRRVTRSFGLYHALYALVLVPSALWLPLTVCMLDAPSRPLWWLIRVDLLLVALGSLGLLASLLAQRGPLPRGRILALLGLLPFCLQTVVLDALVWPAYFPLTAH